MKTPAGVLIPSGWRLRLAHHFGVGLQNNIRNLQELHAVYNEGQYYNTNAAGLVNIPNVVINGEQATYLHFEQGVIAFADDHMTIETRGHPNGTISTGELVSKWAATRSFCVEARYKTPPQQYTWPAFWFYGNAPGHDASEIDVEQPVTQWQGVHDVTMHNHPIEGAITIYNPQFTTQYMNWHDPSFDASASPHFYTTCYDDDASTITRYIDGDKIYAAFNWKWNAMIGGTGKGPNPTLIFNLAVGGNWPGDTPNPQAFSADLDLYSLDYFGP